jgi:hypothetical protein
MQESQPRYKGKPLLRLLECYVLWTIERLSEADANLLNEMTPKLESIYQIKGNWQEIIAGVMHMPPEMPMLIKDLWIKNSEIGLASGCRRHSRRVWDVARWLWSRSWQKF